MHGLLNWGWLAFLGLIGFVIAAWLLRSCLRTKTHAKARHDFSPTHKNYPNYGSE